jgi:hypothetical protein
MAGKPEVRYLDCTFSAGMLGNEYAVEIHIAGTTFSLFADKEDVQVVDEASHRGRLRVWIQDASANLISLPADTLEQGRRFLQVPIDQLRPA